MLFAQMVLRAAEKGVLILAHDIRWHGHQPHWGKELPVVHGAGVTSDIDQEHLERVLHFNATDPRPRWKSSKGNAQAAAQPSATSADAGLVAGGAGVSTDAAAKAATGKAGKGGKTKRPADAAPPNAVVEVNEVREAPAKVQRNTGRRRRA